MLLFYDARNDDGSISHSGYAITRAHFGLERGFKRDLVSNRQTCTSALV